MFLIRSVTKFKVTMYSTDRLNSIYIIIIITVFIHTQEHPSVSLHYKNI